MTDQTAVLQSHIDAVPPGGVLNLGNDIYEIAGTIRLDKPITLRNLEVSTLPSTQKRATILITGDDVKLERVTIDGGNVLGGEPTSTLRIVYTQGLLDSQHGVAILGAQRTTLINCHIHHTVGDGIYAGRAPDAPGNVRPPTVSLIVTGCYVHHTGRNNVALVCAHGAYIDSSIFDMASRSTFNLEVQAGTEGVRDVAIYDNWIGKSRLLFFAAEGYGQCNEVSINRNNLIGDTFDVHIEDKSGGRRRDFYIGGNTSDTLMGNPKRGAVVATRVDLITVIGNAQPMSKRKAGTEMFMVAAIDCTEDTVTGNNVSPYGAGQILVR